MKRQILGALFLDALYQVLDNKVFRILAGVVLALVAATFLVGAREDSLVLLFGLGEIFYEDVFAFFGLPFPGVDGAGPQLIQGLQTLLVDYLAGVGGTVLAVAATAFFVPQMLEKGAADTLFSKPVSRFALLSSRYLAGLLFVALLAIVLVGGMHLGFLVSSGYSDPGFLWSTLTLIYIFGLLHGFSMLVGVLTRSTVAAILLTLVFMTFTGCVHLGWRVKDMALDPVNAARMRAEHEEETEREGTDEEHELNRWQRLGLASLDALHYVLPKTSDASAISRKLRKDVQYRYAELWDEQGGLLIPAPPTGWERRAGSEALEGTGMLWALPDGSATIRLTRRSAEGTTRLRSAKALRISLESRPEVSDVEDGRGGIARTPSSRLDWIESGPQGERLHRAHLFLGGGYLYTLEIEGTRTWREDAQADEVVQQFVRPFTFDGSENATDPSSRYENLLGWNAPLRYNIYFSIGSSLAFLLVVLAAAWWRLARVDF